VASLEQFVKQLEESGVLTAETLGEFLPPRSHPQNGEDLARELVRHKKLTKFQAEEVFRGNGKSLSLGNYVLLEKIGAGGMGQVFKAEHRRMHRIVAVKMLPGAMMQNTAVVARFEREVMAAAKLNHPNIVAAFDADNANGVHLLVMEYVAGSDLAALVKKNGPCSVGQAVNYILQAAKGLQAAHAEGIVHRDIKPANLLLDKEGTVKILDMGLARFSAEVDADKQAGLTNTGTIMGTVDYMAPEQALDTKTADARADIYSLGCSLFYLLIGKPPYLGDTLMNRLLAHREQPIPSVRAIRPDVPDQVAAVCRRMLAKSVDDRYQTMTEMIADLEQLGARQALSPAMQPSPASSADTSVTDFLRDISLADTVPTRRTKSAGPLAGTGKQKLPLIVAGGALGMLALALTIWALSGNRSRQTADGKQPSAKPALAETTASTLEKGETAKPAVAINDPEFQKWMQQVALMPAAAQVTAVAAKLMELNRGFDGYVTPTIEKGVLTRLEFPADQITDLSPVRALAELRWLICCGRGPAEKGQLADLSPLTGMRLTRLDVKYTHVADLSPLTESPLIELFCNYTSVADLAPLRGVPLRQLDISGTEVADLSPLEELRLTWLHFHATRVADLAPLSRLPLTSLGFNESSVCNLSPLAGMHLGEITFNGTRVSDLSPLVGMPLAYVGCLTTNVPDLNLLRGMQLRGIWCDIKSQGDIAILRSFAGLEMIDGNPAANFWTKVDAAEAAFEAWCKQVAGLPAAMQAQAVADKLKEYNPRFDGQVDHTIENGKVVSLAFVSDNVTDISPVRALEGLQKLSCRGSAPGQSRLTDLWPLRGTAVANLDVGQTAVANLAPLSELKLASLDLSGTPVANLSPLARTGLSRLHINNTRVIDLESLTGQVLAELDYSGICVADIAPLQELPLKVVRCGFKPRRDATVLRAISTLETIDGQPAAAFWIEADARQAAFEHWLHDVEGLPAERQVQAVATKLKELNPGFDGAIKSEIVGGVVVRLNFVCDQVTDISPVRALTGLTILECSGSDPSLGKLADLWPLQGLPLQILTCAMSQVSDLSPLKGSSLQGLTIYLTQVRDLSPLAGVPLASLHCGGLTNVTDLAPLRGMPLTLLNFYGSNVTDLGPLRGMPLSVLDFAGAPISDLGPLRGMPLTNVVCSSNRVASLAPLKGMALTNLQFLNTQVTDLSPIRDMPLVYLMCDFSPLRDIEILKTLKNLEQFNGKPAAEFWKEAGVRP
jgi:serine/threonine-protein kinase